MNKKTLGKIKIDPEIFDKVLTKHCLSRRMFGNDRIIQGRRFSYSIRTLDRALREGYMSVGLFRAIEEYTGIDGSEFRNGTCKKADDIERREKMINAIRTIGMNLVDRADEFLSEDAREINSVKISATIQWSGPNSCKPSIEVSIGLDCINTNNEGE